MGGIVALCRRRNPVLEILFREGKAAVDQIPQYIRQFTVVVRLEIFPSEIRVLAFRCVRFKVIAQRIRWKNLEIFIDPDSPVPACGQLFTFDIEKLIRRYLIRENEITMPHKGGGPDNGVKNNIVLADEMDQAGFGIAPVIAPAFRLTLFPGPLNRG